MARSIRQPVIVGASIAGALTALRLAHAQHACSVFEARTHPHAKVCGEGFHPSGRRALEDVLGDVSALGQPLGGFRFTNASEELIGLRHPAPHLGLGCDRLRLERRLWYELAVHPLITFERGAIVRDIERDDGGWSVVTQHRTVPASHLVAADGVRSRLRALAGRSRSQTSGRWGLRQRLEIPAPAPDVVEVCFLDDAEVFLTPLGVDRLSIAVLGEETLVRKLREPDRLQAFLARMQGGDSCQGGRPEAPAQIMPHIGRRAGPWCHDRLYLAGDAAAFLDPISGAGMTLAALSARAIATAIASVMDERVDDRRAESAAEWEMRACLRPFRRLTSFLLLLARAPWFRAGAIGVLRHSPRLLRALARPTLQVHGRSTSVVRDPGKRTQFAKAMAVPNRPQRAGTSTMHPAR